MVKEFIKWCKIKYQSELLYVFREIRKKMLKIIRIPLKRRSFISDDYSHIYGDL